MTAVVPSAALPRPAAASTSEDQYQLIRQLEQQGQYSQSFPLREQALASLVRRQDANMSAMSSSEAKELETEIALCAEELVRLYCCVALELLNRNDFSQSFELLQRASRLTTQGRGMLFSADYDQLRLKALAVVQNNLGLFYYRSGDFGAAVNYLTQAADIESALGASVAESSGTTLINLAQAHIALDGFEVAIPILQRSLSALDSQAQFASVLLQVEDARNLSIHALRLLGTCLEETGSYHLAAQHFSHGMKILKQTLGGKHSADGETKLRQLIEDQRRCLEKASRLPSLPMRSSKSTRVSHARDKRGTRENMHRMQMVSGRPVLQQQKIVTTTVFTPSVLPGDFFAPLSTANEKTTTVQRANNLGASKPNRSVSPPAGMPLTSDCRPIAALHNVSPNAEPSVAPSPRPPLPARGVPPPSVVRQDSSQATAGPSPSDNRHATEADGDDVVLPPAAVDANLATTNLTRHVATKETKLLFKVAAPGLEKIYSELPSKYQEAFDQLAKGPQHLSDKKKASQDSQAPKFVEQVLYSASSRFTTTRPGSASTTTTVQTIRAPVSPLMVKTVAHPKRPVSAQTSRAPVRQDMKEAVSSSFQPSGAEKPKPPLSPLDDGKGVSFDTRRHANNEQPSLAKEASHLLHPSISGTFAAKQSFVRKKNAQEVPIASKPEEDPAVVRAREDAVLLTQQFLRALHAEEVTAELSAALHMRLTIQVELRREEEARAHKRAEEILYQERARMQRELDEARLKFESRRRSTGTMDLATGLSMPSSKRAAAKEEEETSVMHMGVVEMLKSHARTTGERTDAEKQNVTMRADISKKKVEAKVRRSANVALIQRFLRARQSVSIVALRQVQYRDRIFKEYSDNRFRSIAASRIAKFMKWSIEKNREMLRRAAEQSAKLRRETLHQLAISPFVRAKISQVQAARNLFRQRLSAVHMMQRLGRALLERRKMVFRRRERAALVAKQRQDAAVKISRCYRNYKRLKFLLNVWHLTVDDNMKNRREYAATRIQAVWKGHHEGKSLRREWQANLALRKRKEYLAQEEARVVKLVLESVFVIQRAYREHLARRQLGYRKLMRERRRAQYFASHWQDTAVRCLQRFCRIVRARAAVNRQRKINDAILRLQRQKFEFEELARVEQSTFAALRLQRFCRAFQVRSSLGREAGPQPMREHSSGESSFASRKHHTVSWSFNQSNNPGAQSSDSISSPSKEPQSATERNPLDLLPSEVSRRAKSNVSTTSSSAKSDVSSPTLFPEAMSFFNNSTSSSSSAAAPQSNLLLTVGAESTTSFTQALLALGNRREKSETVSSTHPPDHLEGTVPPERKMSAADRSPEVLNFTPAAQRQTSIDDAGSYEDAIKITKAVRVLIRFFRLAVMRRKAKEHREWVRKNTIESEAARFIQDAWRKYAAARDIRARRQQKLSARVTVLQSESAAMIQQAFRHYMYRRKREAKKNLKHVK